MKKLVKRLFHGLFGGATKPQAPREAMLTQALSPGIPRSFSASTYSSFTTAISSSTLDPVVVREHVYAETESCCGSFESYASSIFSVDPRKVEEQTEGTEFSFSSLASHPLDVKSAPLDIGVWGLPCSFSPIAASPAKPFIASKQPIKATRNVKNFLTVLYTLFVLTKDQKIKWDEKELWGWMCRGYVHTMTRKRSQILQAQQHDLFDEIPIWGF